MSANDKNYSTIINDCDNNSEIKAEISKGFDGALILQADGYSDCATEDNKGILLAIENINGVLTLRVFGDINQEEPTHVISLDLAKNENRHVN